MSFIIVPHFIRQGVTGFKFTNVQCRTNAHISITQTHSNSQGSLGAGPLYCVLRGARAMFPTRRGGSTNWEW